MAEKLTGRCLCGAVHFEINEPLVYIAHCHCIHCRRFHGVEHSTYSAVPKSSLQITRGEEWLHTYQGDEGQSRTFCSVCGSSLFASYLPDEGMMVSVAMGAVDGDPGVRPGLHMYVASKAPWDKITDTLPQLDAEWD